ncbi:ABC transporter [Streptomyces sp. F-3]|jgi:ABC-type transport system involved in multi-copper enzyme maturation permease subunit|uniref:ABC transporter permease subunit n=1 Tax=Streptomyces TaxID=1883 RepID=UPI0007C2886C|nr:MULTISPECIES: ABC transporter permease subunit [Streptomyces]MDN5383931.1 ABC transporter permease subunit [Streptomyces sp. LB8]GAT84035.1 ABC transporter [Streptomyces sp. F-3]
MSTPQTPLPQQAAPPSWESGYTSPIPVVRAHLGHAIVSEWTKIRSVRSTVWTLGIYMLIVLGMGALIAWAIVRVPSEFHGSENPLAFGFFGLLVGSVCIITLGVLTVASEYGTGMIRTTMTACPSRIRVLAAKAVVFFLVAFTTTLFSAGLVALVHTALLDGTGARQPTGEEWLRGTLGISLYLAMLGLLSLAVGAILRHSAGAITLMIGVVLAPLVLAAFMQVESLEKLRDALFDYSIPSQMAVFYANTGATLRDSGPSGWDSLWIILGMTAAAFAVACVLLQKRDV